MLRLSLEQGLVNACFQWQLLKAMIKIMSSENAFTYQNNL